jgi:hypothetical protein
MQWGFYRIDVGLYKAYGDVLITHKVFFWLVNDFTKKAHHAATRAVLMGLTAKVLPEHHRVYEFGSIIYEFLEFYIK